MNKKTVKWRDFVKALDVFDDDLGLVGHSGEKKVSPLSKPKKPGLYNLTGLPNLTEDKFLGYLGNREVTILNACIDERFAYWTYSYVNSFKQRLLGGYLGTKIVSIFIAGGAAQSASLERKNALNVIMTYLFENLNVKNAILTGHACNCGGLAHMLFNGKSVCDASTFTEGGPAEVIFVRDKVLLSSFYVVAPEYGSKVRVGVITKQKGKILMV
jgi:hypothetical protein